MLDGLTPDRLLRWSVGVAAVTIALKTLAWVATSSVGLLADALESFVNLAGAMVALWLVTVAKRPPDEDHPYGHHKAEYFSSAFEGLLVIGAACGIAWACVDRLLQPQPLHGLGWGAVLAGIASALNGLLAWAMFRAAREYRSIALEGDARHLVTDVWSSVAVLAGLGATSLTGWAWLDSAVGLLVAVNVLREGVSLVRRSVDGLMDEALEPEVLALVQSTLAGFEHATIRFDHLTTRKAGQRRYVDLHMHMPGDWTLRRAAALRTSVEQALMSAVPGLRASIQLLPSDVEAHFNDARDLI